MSYTRGNGQNGGHFYSNITQPVKIDCNFVVDSTNGNGLGIRSLKSNGYLENVFMHTSATPGKGGGGFLNPNPALGYAILQFKNNYRYYLGGFSGFVSPVSGTPLTSVTAGLAYIIVSLGTTTLAQWMAAGVPAGFVPSVGLSFIAIMTGSIGGSGAVEVPSVSGIADVEVVGDPNQSLNNSNIFTNSGARLLLQFLGSGSGGSGPVGPSGPAAPNLANANGFEVLAGTAFTNVGSGTVVTGDAGATTFTAFPPGTLVGTQHTADSAYNAGIVSLASALADLASRPFNVDMSGIDLGGKILTPGTYHFSSSAVLTGVLTLDAQNNPNAVWIFQIGSTLTTASASSVVLINGARPGMVFWQVGSSATLGTTTSFQGNILAQTAITLNNGANVLGRLQAHDAGISFSGTSAATIQSDALVPVSSSGGLSAPANGSVVGLSSFFDISTVTIDGL